MTSEYFSDQERGAVPRVNEEFTLDAWGGVAAAIQRRIDDGTLGFGFPNFCDDGRGICGTNVSAFDHAVNAEISGVFQWNSDFRLYSFDYKHTPQTLAILDLLQFVFRYVGKPEVRDHHDYFGHDHLVYDRKEGQAEFQQDVNRILARNGLAFELTGEGQIIRLAPSVLGEALSSSLFATGDSELDAMLETARKKFLNPNPSTRREALEKLWDAWERLKTVFLPEANKKLSATAMLDLLCTEQCFRKELETEAAQLTSIGNSFLIRHSEVPQVSIGDDSHVDYLFHRMFAFIWMVLKKMDDHKKEK